MKAATPTRRRARARVSHRSGKAKRSASRELKRNAPTAWSNVKGIVGNAPTECCVRPSGRRSRGATAPARGSSRAGFEQRLERAGMDGDVGVRRRDPFRVGPLRDQVHRRAEAEVLLGGDQVDPAEPLAHEVRASRRSTRCRPPRRPRAPLSTSGLSDSRQRARRSRVFHETIATVTGGGGALKRQRAVEAFVGGGVAGGEDRPASGRTSARSRRGRRRRRRQRVAVLDRRSSVESRSRPFASAPRSRISVHVKTTGPSAHPPPRERGSSVRRREGVRDVEVAAQELGHRARDVRRARA